MLSPLGWEPWRGRVHLEAKELVNELIMEYDGGWDGSWIKTNLFFFFFCLGKNFSMTWLF